MFASGRDVIGEPFPDFTINRTEAARINREAAAIFRATGDETRARSREDIARYYEADDAERAAARPGFYLTRWLEAPDGTPSMRATTSEELRLRAFEMRVAREQGEHAPRDTTRRPRRFETLMVNPGALQARIEKGEVTEGSVRVPNSARGTSYDRRGRPSPVETATQNPELNQPGVNGARYVGAAGTAINLANTWTPLLVDLYTARAANRIHTRDRLARQVFAATHSPVPARPHSVAFAQVKGRTVQIREIVEKVEEYL